MKAQDSQAVGSREKEQRSDAQAAQRRPYSKPQLRKLGPMASVTAFKARSETGCC